MDPVKFLTRCLARLTAVDEKSEAKELAVLSSFCGERIMKQYAKRRERDRKSLKTTVFNSTQRNDGNVEILVQQTSGRGKSRFKVDFKYVLAPRGRAWVIAKVYMRCFSCKGTGKCSWCYGTGEGTFGEGKCNMCKGNGKCDACKGKVWAPSAPHARYR